MCKNWLEEVEKKRNNMLARKRHARQLQNIYGQEENL